MVARHGYVLYNVNDHYVGRSIERYGEWSPGETALFRPFCRPGHYVVDVGAHIGTHTLAFARLVGDRGRVFAFEPQRLVAQVLAANAAPGSLTNVHTHHLGVGRRTARSSSLTSATRASTTPAASPWRRSPAARATRARSPGSPWSASTTSTTSPGSTSSKIDVEGMEVDVLRGAATLIRRHKPAIYAENDRPEKSPELIGLIRSHGYRLFWHRPPLYSPDNFAGSPVNLFERIASFNTLCVHASANVQVRGAQEITDAAAHPLAR